MDLIKTHQESAGDVVRRSLDWDAYEIDWGISRGMQDNTKVLTRKNDSPGPDTPRVCLGRSSPIAMLDPDLPLIQHIFEKRYDLTGWRKQDVKIVKKAFERESSISQRLNHPHIVAYLGCKDVEKDTPRLYFEYCEGSDLRDDVEPPTSPQTTAPSPTPLSLVSPTVYDSGVDPLEVPSPEEKELAEPRRWSESQVWRLIYHLYSALAYLHYGVSISNEHEQCVYESSWDPIIHCDINPRNGE
jgi:serine/threonine protein kinase